MGHLLSNNHKGVFLLKPCSYKLLKIDTVVVRYFLYSKTTTKSDNWYHYVTGIYKIFLLNQKYEGRHLEDKKNRKHVRRRKQCYKEIKPQWKL